MDELRQDVQRGVRRFVKGALYLLMGCRVEGHETDYEARLAEHDVCKQLRAPWGSFIRADRPDGVIGRDAHRLSQETLGPGGIDG